MFYLRNKRSQFDLYYYSSYSTIMTVSSSKDNLQCFPFLDNFDFSDAGLARCPEFDPYAV
jgi:hypothetical protein